MQSIYKGIIDNGTDNVGNLSDITACDPSKAQEAALVTLYAVFSNDHISSNFRKGKMAFVQ